MEQISLRKSEHTSVTLKGLGSAGYRWSFTVDDPQVVSVERQLLQHKPEEEHSPTFSADEVFLLTGQKPGETMVHFSQSRSFEPSKPPVAKREILVRVHDS